MNVVLERRDFAADRQPVRLKIRRLEVFKLNITFTQPRKVSYTGEIDKTSALAVKITTDEGAVGWGGTVALGIYNGSTSEMTIEGLKGMGRTLLGETTEIDRLHRIMDGALMGNPAIKAGIDLAIYDLNSKAWGVRVVDLLGGQLHADIPTVYSLRFNEPDVMAEEAKRHMADGIRGFEMHIGTTIDQDVARVRAVREALGPDGVIVADANQHWSPKEAIAVIAACEPFHLTAVEQPTKGLAGMATVRAQTRTPITADESCHSMQDVVEIIQHQAADIACIKLMKAGGLYPSKKMAIVSEAFGLGIRIDGAGAAGETRLSTTAAACLVASLPKVVGPGVMQHRHLKEDFVTAGGMTFSEGRVTPPAGLGLVESVDESLLERVGIVE